MKQKYIIPTVEISAVAARATFMENVSFTIDNSDPRGGWADTKERDEISDEETEWSRGLW